MCSDSLYGPRSDLDRYHAKRMTGRGGARTAPTICAAMKNGAFAAAIRRTEEFAPAFEKALSVGRAAVLDIHLDPEAISPRTTLSRIREDALASARRVT